MTNAALIVTRNILAEDKIQSLFQRMDFEVLVTDKCNLNQNTILKNPNMMAYFGVIIFSDTISDVDIKNYIEESYLGTKKLFRMYDGEMMIAPKKPIAGYSVWHIHENDRITTIQKYLHQSGYYEEQESLLAGNKPTNSSIGAYSALTGNVLSNSYQVSTKHRSNDSLEIFVTKLSRTQKQVFDVLLENKGNAVSKKEICNKLWENVTNSRMTQVSGLIKAIRQKMGEYKIDSFELTTEWGKGYSILEIPEERRNSLDYDRLVGINSMAM